MKKRHLFVQLDCVRACVCECTRIYRRYPRQREGEIDNDQLYEDEKLSEHRQERLELISKK